MIRISPISSEIIKKLLFYTVILIFFSHNVNAQFGNIQGKVKLDQNYAEYVTIYISNNSSLGASTDSKGFFEIKNIPYGTYEVFASYIGYQNEYKKIVLNNDNQMIELDFNLLEISNSLNEVVITGTKTFKRRTQSPVRFSRGRTSGLLIRTCGRFISTIHLILCSFNAIPLSLLTFD